MNRYVSLFVLSLIAGSIFKWVWNGAGEVPEAPGEVQPVEGEATRRKSEKAAEQ